MPTIAYSVTPIVQKIRSGTLDTDTGYASFRGLGEAMPEGGILKSPTFATPLIINPFPTLTTILGGGIGAAIGMKAKSPGWAIILAAIFGWALSGFSPNLMKGFAAGLGGAGLVRLRRGG